MLFLPPNQQRQSTEGTRAAYTMKNKGPRTDPCIGTPQEEVGLYEEEKVIITSGAEVSRVLTVLGPLCS